MTCAFVVELIIAELARRFATSGDTWTRHLDALSLEFNLDWAPDAHAASVPPGTGSTTGACFRASHQAAVTSAYGLDAITFTRSDGSTVKG